MAKGIPIRDRPKTLYDKTVVKGVEIVARPAIPRSPPHGFWPDSLIRSAWRAGMMKPTSQGSLHRANDYYQQSERKEGSVKPKRCFYVSLMILFLVLVIHPLKTAADT